MEEALIPVSVINDSEASVAPIYLEWKNLTYAVNEKKKGIKQILQGVSGEARPGEMLAIMGSSGAGKTTLLKMLAGRVPHDATIGGTITLNGQKRTSAFRKQAGYVQQENLLLPNLTVRETLRFHALLRVPRATPFHEKMRFVDSIISELGLEKCADTLVGGTPLVPGISGGERRRVSIAVELINNPGILFMDEPTSGLDSTTAFRVVSTSKKLAQRNRTVVMTIHQPKASIFHLFDKILLLADGHLVFFGTSTEAFEFFKSAGFPCPQYTNPADFYLDCISIDPESPESIEKSKKQEEALTAAFAEWRISKSESKSITFEKNRPAPIYTRENGTSSDDTYEYTNNWCQEIYILFVRNLYNFLREKQVTVFALIQSTFLGLLIGGIYYGQDLAQSSIQNRQGVLFFVVMNQCFGPIFGIMTVFVMEKAIFHQEQISGAYRVSTYFLAKNFSEILFQLLIPFIFGSICYFMIGLQNTAEKFFTFQLCIIMTCLCSQSLGLTVAAGIRKIEIGTVIVPIILIIFMLFAGFYINSDTISDVFIWLKWLSYIQYSYRATMKNEFEGLVFDACSPGQNCFQTGEEVLDYFGLSQLDVWTCIVVLAGMSVFFRFMAFLLLKYKDLPKLRFE